METVYRDYSPKGVKFYYIYKALAHPEWNGYVKPFSLEERLMHIKEAQRTLGSEITWISDSMSNDVKHSLGNAPNSEFVIDPEGKVARSRVWSRPEELRRDLEQLISPVENPTKVSDLNLKVEPPPKVAASGVVPRVELPGRMRALKIVPKKGPQPFYAKLRAEADEGLLRSGKGTMYIGLRLDPLYRVHWNNLVDPVKYEVKAPKRTTVTPAKGIGPKVKEASDIDPREFLLEVKRADDSREPLHLDVKYYACNDDEGWCVPVRQEYSIYLEPDMDGGSRMNRGRPGSGGARGMSMNRPGGRGFPGIGAMFERFDANGDGKITEEEVPEGMPIMRRFDINGDGTVTKKEVSQRAPRGRP